MRLSGWIIIPVLVVFGAMLAELETHPAGTTAAANGLVNIEKPGLNAVLGQSTK